MISCNFAILSEIFGSDSIDLLSMDYGTTVDYRKTGGERQLNRTGF